MSSDPRTDILKAFAACSNLPPSWTSDNDLVFWQHIQLDTNTQSLVIGITFPENTSTGITGHIDVAALPRSLRTLTLGLHLFSGEFNLADLPPQLEILEAQHADTTADNEKRCSKLTGVFDASKLPRTLKQLSLVNNDFRGTVVTRDLPPRLESLRLAMNPQLGGSFDIGELPTGLEELQIMNCNFSGPCEIAGLPRSISIFDVSHNKFTGIKPTKPRPVPMWNVDGNPWDGEKCVLQ